VASRGKRGTRFFRVGKKIAEEVGFETPDEAAGALGTVRK